MKHFSTKTVLKQYGAACQVLLDESSILDQDLEFVVGGGTILFAVDFSELFAYAQPDQTERELELIPFDVRDARSPVFYGDFLRVRQLRYRALLDRLFYEPESPAMILLEPYALELESFIRRTARRGEQDSNTAERAILEQAELFEQTPEWARIQGVARAAATGSSISESDRGEVIRFLEANAAAILTVTTGRVTEPLHRLHGLFQAQRLASATILANVQFSLRDARVERLSREILKAKTHYHQVVDDHDGRHLKSRKKADPAAAQLDALAVATVAKINTILNPKRTRLLLVSRSRALQTALATLHRRGGGDDPRSILRHPRQVAQFNFMLNLRRTSPPGVMETEAATRREPLRRIASLVGEYLDRASPTRAKDSDQVAELLRQVEANWVTSYSIEGLVDQAVIATVVETPDEVGEFLRLLGSQSDWRSAVLDRIHAVRLELARVHEALGTYLGSSRPSGLLGDEAEIGIDTAGPVIVLSSRPDLAECAIGLKSDAARTALESLQRPARPSQVIEVARSALTRTADSEAATELLLMIAFASATAGEWDFAQTYCGFAVEESYRADRSSVFKAAMLSANCLRHQAEATPHDLLEMIKLLERTTALEEELQPFRMGYFRMLTEIGFLLLWLQLLDPGARWQGVRDRPARISALLSRLPVGTEESHLAIRIASLRLMIEISRGDGRAEILKSLTAALASLAVRDSHTSLFLDCLLGLGSLRNDPIGPSAAELRLVKRRIRIALGSNSLDQVERAFLGLQQTVLRTL